MSNRFDKVKYEVQLPNDDGWVMVVNFDDVVEEAQKLEEQINELITQNCSPKYCCTYNEYAKLEKQIGEALKILDEFPVYPMKETRGNWLKRLREVLK